MGIAEKQNMGFHIFHHHGKKELLKDSLPKGCLAIMVGDEGEQRRFVVPVMYINHPLFLQLLKEAEEEYGFDQKGPITIPCQIDKFWNVRDLIDQEHHLLNHHHLHNHHRHHHIGCFN